MAALKKKQTVNRTRAENPVKAARNEFKKYQSIYGNNILLDQAVRVVTSWANSKLDINQFDYDRVLEIYDQSEIIERASRMVANEKQSKSSAKKADLIQEIRWHLLDCLGIK